MSKTIGIALLLFVLNVQASGAFSGFSFIISPDTSAWTPIDVELLAVDDEGATVTSFTSLVDIGAQFPEQIVFFWKSSIRLRERDRSD